MNPGRRGVQGTKIGSVGPTVVARNNHQSGGCGGDGLCSRGSSFPAGVFQGQKGPQIKFTKM